MHRVTAIIFSFFLFATSSFAQINTDKVMAIGKNALYFEDYVLSIQYFNQVIKVKPYLADPYFYRAVAKINLNDYQGAIEDCTLCIERNPFIVKAYECRGIARQQLKDYDGAVSDFEKVLDYSPDNKGIMLNMAIAQAQTKNFDRSEQVFTGLFKRYPNYDVAYLSRAQMYAEKGDTISAIADLDKAIELDKFSSYAYATRAMINYQKENYTAAVEDYSQAIKIDSDQPGFYVNRGLAYYQSSNLRAAMSDYDKAVELDPENIISRYNRGLLRAQVADDNRAIEDFDKVIAAEPDNFFAYYNRAILRMKTGNYRGAVQDFSTVLKEYPDYIPGYQARGQAKHLMGDAAGGDRDFMTAYRMQEKYKNDLRKGKVSTTDNQTDLASKEENEDEKTRQQSDKNIRKFNRVVVASNDKFAEKYTNELRGRIQNKNVDVEILPSFVATYYEKPDPLKNKTYYNRALIDFNKKHPLGNNPLCITNAEIALNEEQSKQHFASINFYSKMTQDEPGNAFAYFARGIDFMLVQDFSSAVEDFTKATNLNDTLTLAYFNKAVVLTKQLEYETSFGEFDINQSKTVNLSSALKDTRQTAPGVNPPSDVKTKSLDYELIFKEYEKVIRLSPKFMYAYYNRANICFVQKDFRNAVTDYSAAINIEPEFAEAYFNRGLTYVYLGENRKAIADLSKAGELGIVGAYNIIKRLSEPD